MNTRPKDDQGAMEKLGARVRQRAMTGTEASTIGFILVAYIGVFAGLGYWLDTFFKTSWIVAVGVLLGALVGFREMFRMAQKLTRESIAEDAHSERSKWSKTREKSSTSASTAEEESELETPPRARIFSVPAPPAASFDKPKSKPASTPASVDEPEGEELIERLLQNTDQNDDLKGDEPEDGVR